MKFIFVSHGINPIARKKLLEFVNNKSSKIKVLFIDTPAKTYQPEPAWLLESYNELVGMGMAVERYDIEEAFNKQEDIEAKINKYDIVAVSGGNVFYFLFWAEKVGLKRILENYLNNGGVYLGESAGVVCHVKNIEPLKLIDSPEKAPGVVNHGLELTNFIVIPHWGNKKYQELLEKTRQEYSNQRLKTEVLRDGEVMFIEGDKFEIISPQQ